MPKKSNPAAVTFTLAEANKLLPQVIAATDQVKTKLRECRHPWHALGIRKYNVLADLPEEDHLYVQWATQIAGLGAWPKGQFTVDFRSTDPEVVYCWKDGETEITHQHKAWEDYSHRRPIEDE